MKANKITDWISFYKIDRGRDDEMDAITWIAMARSSQLRKISIDPWVIKEFFILNIKIIF